jgi:outer membrane autotransporter protein
VTRISFGDIPVMTTDGTNFGNYLDKIVDYLSENDPNGDLSTLLSQILTGDKDKYGHAVNELSGHQNADMLLASLGIPGHLADIIFGQLGGSGLGGSAFADLGTLVQISDNSVSALASDDGSQSGILGKAAGSSPVAKQTTVWARAFGNWASLDRNAGIGAAGFTSNGGGVVAGGDYKFSDNFKAGLAAGYQKDKVDYHGAGKSDITSWSLSAYGRADAGPLYVDGLLGYSHQDYTQHRYYQPVVPGPVYTANRDPNGSAYTVGAEAGYDYDLGSQAKLEPFLGFLYSHTSVDGSTETGTGPGNLTISDQSANSASSRLGVRWSQTFGSAGSSTWTPMLELGWKHEFADTNPSTTAALAGIPGASFTVQGAGVPKDSALVGAGLTMQLSDALDGTVQYNGDFSDRYTDSTASLRLRMKF